MNGFDATILVLLFLTTALGAWRGFIRQVTRLLALILGLFLARSGAPIVARALGEGGGYSILALAYFGIFAGTLFLASFLGLQAQKTAEKADLGDIDRWLGGGLGFVKGLLIAYLLLFACLLYTGRETKERLRESVAVDLMIRGLSASQIFFPRPFISEAERFEQESILAGKEESDRGTTTLQVDKRDEAKKLPQSQ